MKNDCFQIKDFKVEVIRSDDPNYNLRLTFDCQSPDFSIYVQIAHDTIDDQYLVWFSFKKGIYPKFGMSFFIGIQDQYEKYQKIKGMIKKDDLFLLASSILDEIDLCSKFVLQESIYDD